MTIDDAELASDEERNTETSKQSRRLEMMIGREHNRESEANSRR
jgi:hypothetical protein